MIVGLLGILKAGAAYLPLDPDYPAERLAFMLADAAAPVLVTQASLQARLPAYGGASVRLDADWPAIARHPARAPGLALDPHHPAYVIYTSGSTGSPKGVVVTMAASSTSYALVDRRPAIDVHDVSPRSTIIGFDAAGWEIFCRWFQARLCAGSPGTQPRRRSLWSALFQSSRITMPTSSLAAACSWQPGRLSGAIDVA